MFSIETLHVKEDPYTFAMMMMMMMNEEHCSVFFRETAKQPGLQAERS